MKHTLFLLTIADLLSAEIASRRQIDCKMVYDGKIDGPTATHRLECLKTALWMHTGFDEPGIKKSIEQVLEEMRRWRKRIQANSTVATMHTDGRKLALIDEFIEAHQERPADPEQTKLFQDMGKIKVVTDQGHVLRPVVLTEKYLGILVAIVKEEFWYTAVDCRTGYGFGTPDCLTPEEALEMAKKRMTEVWKNEKTAIERASIFPTLNELPQ